MGLGQSIAEANIGKMARQNAQIVEQNAQIIQQNAQIIELLRVQCEAIQYLARAKSAEVMRG